MKKAQVKKTPKTVAARNVSAWRKKHRITQADLASRCGMRQQSICRFERGRNVRIDTLERIATAIGIDLPSLMTENAMG